VQVAAPGLTVLPGTVAPGRPEPFSVREHDETTVKLVSAGSAPSRPRPRPRPSPRPRALGAPGPSGVVGVAGAIGVVEGPASATTKAPAVPVVLADGHVEPAPHDPSVVCVLPVVRETGFTPAAAAGPPSVPPGGLEPVALPAAPALVCDMAERIVQVNTALLRLSGRADAETGLHGTHLANLVVGPDSDAHLVRVDGAPVRVRVVRWELAERKLQVVVLVELLDAYAAEIDRDAARRWTAELERMARVGTWRYELATGTLHRSESLQELYRGMGVEPDGSGGPVEGEQVALLVRALRIGTPTRDHQAELALPGARLRCRAEVELGPDGQPVRLTGVVRDITAEHESEARARHAALRFADLATLSPTGIAMVDPDGHIREGNPALCDLLDVDPEQLRGLHVAALAADPIGESRAGALDGPLRPPLPAWLCPVPPGAAHRYRVEAVPLLRGDGTTVWCELAVSATTVDDDTWLWLVACTDIGEKRRAAELLRSAGTVDELTRLPNRAASLELLDRLLARPDRDRVAVVCGDVDDFQRVNSSLGHDAGDDLLVALAGRLQRDLPVGCTAARLAADEFVVVCGDVDEAGGPEALAATVAELLRTTVAVRGRPVQLTASVGLAVPQPGSDVASADLLRFAEIAMHDAKRTCRGGFAMATDRVLAATGALELEAELRAALATDGLVLEYQPVVGPDGIVSSAEALIRWPHPERGVISPAEFLPIAQRGGMLRELDVWVLRTATREAATWPEHGGRPVAVAVNLAGLLPGDPAFRSTVTDIVESAGLPWDRLVLEVVETSLVALPPHALAAMDGLVQQGVRFAVDDFGTGYSSLARLKELPAQIVKVDRAFVTGVGTDPADFAVARAVVDMAKAMGRSTVAEGVETTEQYHVLRGVGVDAFQGWLFARSLPAWQLREVLSGDRMAVPASATG
jgi:diguanylate cyclase (GGDEF)-like protein